MKNILLDSLQVILEDPIIDSLEEDDITQYAFQENSLHAFQAFDEYVQDKIENSHAIIEENQLCEEPLGLIFPYDIEGLNAPFQPKECPHI